MSLLGNLAGSGYDCTPEQVDAMFGAVQAALDSARAQFDRGNVIRFRF